MRRAWGWVRRASCAVSSHLPWQPPPADTRSCDSLYSLCDLGPLQLHHHPPSEHRGRRVDDVSKRVTVLPGGWGCVQSLTSQEGWGEPPGVELGALVREGCRMLVVCGDSGTWGGV